jgi:DNA-directed RNA polymerase specialized sigma24 family protein
VTPEEIGRILDPTERARQAQGFILRAQAAIRRVRVTRDNAVVEMRLDGASQRDVAKVLGISPGRAAQIDNEKGVRTKRVCALDSRRKR